MVISSLLSKALAHIEELVQKCKIQEESEKQLKAQLAVYTEKYQEFQTTLSKSNQVFETFKSEMDKVSGLDLRAPCLALADLRASSSR